MSSTWKLNEKSTGELRVSVSGDIWKNAQEKAFKKLAKTVKIAGFRPGQAPEALVKKQIDPKSILMDAMDIVAQDALTSGIEEHDLWIVARPNLDIESIDEKQVSFKFIIAVKPDVKLGEYKKLGISKDSVKIGAQDIEEELNKLQQRFADLVVKEKGKVENGDTIILDFEGFKDGEPFDGGKADNYSLEIGSGSFIPGFEEQCLGLKSGDTKDISVTFPENYQVSELAGSPVLFKIKVHEIKGKVLPEIDDKLIKQAKIDKVSTVEKYKEHMQKQLEENAENEATYKFESECLTMICENATVEIPDAMIEQETDQLVQDFEQRLKSQGFELEQYFQMSGQSMEMIRGEMRKDAESKVKVRLVLEAVGDAEKIEIDDKAIEAEIGEIAKKYSMEVEKVKEMIDNSAIAYDLKIRKALEIVKELAGK